MKATWEGKTIAESDGTVVVDGHHYFPMESVRKKFLASSSTTTFCGWKGTASYFNIVVDGDRKDDAAWYYPDPMEAAANIKDHVAFWKGVEVSDG